MKKIVSINELPKKLKDEVIEIFRNEYDNIIPDDWWQPIFEEYETIYDNNNLVLDADKFTFDIYRNDFNIEGYLESFVGFDDKIPFINTLIKNEIINEYFAETINFLNEELDVVIDEGAYNYFGIDYDDIKYKIECIFNNVYDSDDWEKFNSFCMSLIIYDTDFLNLFTFDNETNEKFRNFFEISKYFDKPENLKSISKIFFKNEVDVLLPVKTFVKNKQIDFVDYVDRSNEDFIDEFMDYFFKAIESDFDTIVAHYNDVLQKLYEAFTDELKKTYESYMSDDYILDLIEANDYEISIECPKNKIDVNCKILNIV